MVQGQPPQLQRPPLGFDLGPILSQSQRLLQALQAALLHNVDIADRILRPAGAIIAGERLQVESIMLPAGDLPHDGFRGGRGDSKAL